MLAQLIPVPGGFDSSQLSSSERKTARYRSFRVSQYARPSIRQC